VLLVDSDPAVHEQLLPLLERDGRTVEAAFDGREALAKLREHACGVILAGQGTKDFDNLKLLRKAKLLRPETPVIVTGEPDAARVVHALKLRAYSYFHKPLAARLLADMTIQALQAVDWQDELKVISARPDWLSLDVRCKMDAAERTTQFFREVHADLPPQTREDIAAAFRELLLNGIEHGANSDPRKRVHVAILRTARSVIVHVHDPGKGFSLDSLPHAAISNPDEEPARHINIRLEQGRRPGGFGILMTRNMVDELLYNERGNSVLFVKYLS
jgi:DNA-binding NarL/FixJ family response regulator